MIEYGSVDIAIGGDSRAVIHKSTVSIPEIVILQSLHGDDAITNIRIDGTWDTPDDVERDRLGILYKDSKVIEVFQKYGDLPKTLKDARIGEALLDPVFVKELSEAPAPKKTIRKRARKADGSFKADDPTTPQNEAWEQ